MIKKFILSTILFALLSVNAFAAISDAFSRSYWVSKSGYTTGTVNDIQYKYFGSLGYTGSLNDRYKAWLAHETGLSTSLSFNTLLTAYFNANIYNGDGQIILNGDGGSVTYQ